MSFAIAASQVLLIKGKTWIVSLLLGYGIACGYVY